MTKSEAYRLIASAQSYLLFGHNTWNMEAHRILAAINSEMVSDPAVCTADIEAGAYATGRWSYIGKLEAAND